jgi:hypothetical protein
MAVHFYRADGKVEKWAGKKFRVIGQIYEGKFRPSRTVKISRADKDAVDDFISRVVSR